MNRKEEHLYEKALADYIYRFSPFDDWKFFAIYNTNFNCKSRTHTQNVSSSLQTSNQSDRTSVKKAMRDSLQLGYPGILAQISKGGKWSYAAGIADLRTKKQMKTEFRFRIGSTTKTFIATVLLQLAGENRLNLDDSIEKWLPGVIQGNGYDANQITIRQILNHTSGIAEYLKSKDYDIMDTKNCIRLKN